MIAEMMKHGVMNNVQGYDRGRGRRSDDEERVAKNYLG